MPDSRTLKECGVPIFETYATPVNVSVRPSKLGQGSVWNDSAEKKKRNEASAGNSAGVAGVRGGRGGRVSSEAAVGTVLSQETTGQGCACVIL